MFTSINCVAVHAWWNALHAPGEATWQEALREIKIHWILITICSPVFMLLHLKKQLLLVKVSIHYITFKINYLGLS